jgi:hypothetical protein
MLANAEIETIKSKLNAERAKLMAALKQLSSDELMRPLEDGWSAKDVVAHLAMAEAVNVKFAKLMLAHDGPVQLRVMAQDFPDYIARGQRFSLDDFNSYMTEKLRAKSLDEVMRSLDETRADTLAWVDTLTSVQLERGGQHAAWGDQTVRGMLKILVIHDKFHTQDILKRGKTK